MNKTVKFYGIILLVVIVLLGILELSKNEVTNWTKSYDINKKMPFGLYVFRQESKDVFKLKLTEIPESPFDYYNVKKNEKPHNILVISRDLDKSSWEKILNEVKKGSDALLCGETLPNNISDSLNFFIHTVSYDEKMKIKLTDQKFAADSLYLDKFPEGKGFFAVKKNQQLLGFAEDNSNKNFANFIRIQHGKGKIYVHTEPLFLTNYYLLKGKNSEKYAEAVLSYLPDRQTLWFTDTANSPFGQGNALAFILSKPALRYAWWLFLAGLLLFVIFNVKRDQRRIPIIEPLKNKSAEFVKSIGNLYLQEGDFHEMMAKKAHYFLSKVRLDLLLDTQQLDEDFAKKLHSKTGKSREKIDEAIVLLKKAQDPYSAVMKQDLARMNKLLDEILK